MVGSMFDFVASSENMRRQALYDKLCGVVRDDLIKTLTEYAQVQHESRIGTAEECHVLEMYAVICTALSGAYWALVRDFQEVAYGMENVTFNPPPADALSKLLIAFNSKLLELVEMTFDDGEHDPEVTQGVDEDERPS